MSKSNGEILLKNATAGFDAFEEKMLKNAKESIFKEAYEINAKNEIYGYLCDCASEDLDENDIKILVNLGEAVIERLYNYYLSQEYASIMSYNEITEWIEWFCEKIRQGGNYE